MADLTLHPTTGQVVAGVGTGLISVDNHAVPNALKGGSPDWLDAGHLIYNGTVDGSLFDLWAIAATGGAQHLVQSPGGTLLYTGGGRWASFLSSLGVRDSTGLDEPSWALYGVGDSGNLYYCPNRNNRGMRVRQLNGADLEILPPSQLGSANRVREAAGGIVWAGFDRQLHTHNLPAPQTVPNQPAGWPSIVAVGSTLWLIYVAGERLVAHPLEDPSKGYLLATGGQSFYPHAIPWQGGIRYAFSLSQGAQPGQIVIATLDLSRPMVPLSDPRPPDPKPPDPPDPQPPKPEPPSMQPLPGQQTIVSPFSYDTFIQNTPAEVDYYAQAYTDAHGHLPGQKDLAQCFYRRLFEGWTPAHIWDDIYVGAGKPIPPGNPFK